MNQQELAHKLIDIHSKKEEAIREFKTTYEDYHILKKNIEIFDDLLEELTKLLFLSHCSTDVSDEERNIIDICYDIINFTASEPEYKNNAIFYIANRANFYEYIKEIETFDCFRYSDLLQQDVSIYKK